MNAPTTRSGAPPEMVTFGCRLNSVESSAMRAMAEQAGQRDLVIVNTCAVTAEAVKQARQAIRRLKREDPGRRIVVTGCAAQIEPESFAAMDGVSQVVGNLAKLDPETWQSRVLPDRPVDFAAAAEARILGDDIMAIRETASHFPQGIERHTRAFVQVQNGCDHRCTFCIIPFGRGPSRSVPMGAVVAHIGRLIADGHCEVVLTGVDLTSYGADLPGRPGLGALVGAVLKHNPELRRLRLSSLDPVEVDDRLVRLLKSEPRLMPHLHLSLQSGDNLILKRMKRRHSREDAIRFCADLRAARPDFVFGADLIAGFPTESEAMFENSLRLVDECELTFLHVFPYSPRAGTPAERMPQVERAVIKARAARLRARGEAALAQHLARYVGRQGDVLVERGGLGRLPDFTPVRLEGSPAPGVLARAGISGHQGGMLTGSLAMAQTRADAS